MIRSVVMLINGYMLRHVLGRIRETDPCGRTGNGKSPASVIALYQPCCHARFYYNNVAICEKNKLLCYNYDDEVTRLRTQKIGFVRILLFCIEATH